jgi:hypothetical protein
MQDALKVKSLEDRIEKLILEAVELADIGGIRVTTRAIAERVYDSEPELMQELQRFWMVDRLIWMLSRKRRARRRFHASEAQMVLAGFEGLPRSIFQPNGQRLPMDNATTTQVREHIKMLRARLKASSRIELLEAVVELMSSYRTPTITWGEVKRRELAKREGEQRG